MHLVAFCLWLKFWEMIDEDGLSAKDIILFEYGQISDQKWASFRNVYHPSLVTNLVSDLDLTMTN